MQILTSDVEIEAASGYPMTAAAEGVRSQANGHPPKSKGYLNRASGWLHAAASVQFLPEKMRATNPVNLIVGTIAGLLYSSSHCSNSGRRAVLGVLTTSGQEIQANQIILAADPYTAGLIDLRAVCEARGQVISYIKLTQEELSRLAAGGNPAMKDASSGVYVVGPDHEGYLKVTSHTKGYRNSIRITVASDGQLGFPGLDASTEYSAQTNGEDEKTTNKVIETSIPWEDHGKTWTKTTPADGEAICRDFLNRLFPPSSPLAAIATRPFAKTRVCWYCDTRSGDFVISYHPSYADGSLFIATGGSGHGFKFFRIIGAKI